MRAHLSVCKREQHLSVSCVSCLLLCFHCLSLCFHCLPLRFHCLAVCLPLRFHCLPLRFHCLAVLSKAESSATGCGCGRTATWPAWRTRSAGGGSVRGPQSMQANADCAPARWPGSPRGVLCQVRGSRRPGRWRRSASSTRCSAPPRRHENTCHKLPLPFLVLSPPFNASKATLLCAASQACDHLPCTRTAFPVPRKPRCPAPCRRPRRRWAPGTSPRRW